MSTAHLAKLAMELEAGKYHAPADLVTIIRQCAQEWAEDLQAAADVRGQLAMANVAVSESEELRRTQNNRITKEMAAMDVAHGIEVATLNKKILLLESQVRALQEAAALGDNVARIASALERMPSRMGVYNPQKSFWRRWLNLTR